MKRILFIISFLFCLRPAFGQVYSIGVDSGGQIIGLADTIAIGDTVNCSVIVKNYSGTAFLGTVAVNLAIDTSNGLQSFGPIDTFTYQFPSGGTYTWQYNDTFPSSYFRIGGNVIVIWPAAFNAATLDSAWAIIYVIS